MQSNKSFTVKEALQITGSLSKPSKMPGWAYGLPAKECKTGGKLQAVPGSVCYDLPDRDWETFVALHNLFYSFLIVL